MLSHGEIKGLLPHRYPMLLVDAVRDLDPWVSIVGIKSVTAAEPCFGHLGDARRRASYAYPCSLIIESFAQTAGILMCGRLREDGRAGAELLFGSLSGARFSGEAFPGDTLEHRARLDRQVSDVGVLAGEVWVGSRRIAQIDQILAKAWPLHAGSAAGTSREATRLKEEEP